MPLYRGIFYGQQLKVMSARLRGLRNAIGTSTRDEKNAS
ncbi:hypothetical protein swp_2095 [Shewanella piezotolerans WP3]|uniref:Uncharacterized protein n=1 Tax=Shewanella piezotolerans (strain WP3 / JCM 13877) TaxID=225849 RepID=B8CLS5_SHEPW|nr:hypothetical protein swp_2095 [Shewanella piezotolerans WP3]